MVSTLSDCEPERILRRLGRLELGRGPLSVEPISGGITNHNYVVRAEEPSRKYVARLCEPRPMLGIDRPNERACQEAASTWGVAPR